jgi:hypothetical protein
MNEAKLLIGGFSFFFCWFRLLSVENPFLSVANRYGSASRDEDERHAKLSWTAARASHNGCKNGVNGVDRQQTETATNGGGLRYARRFPVTGSVTADPSLRSG